MSVLYEPITVTKVLDALITKANDIGLLCKSDKVNKWAKYKPVISDDVTRKSTDLPYISGMNYSGILDTILNIALAENGEYGWNYEKPTVGPYRLGDFVKYNHLAVCPIKINIPDKIVQMSGVAPVVSVELDSEIGSFDEDTNISCSDILADYDDYRLTVAVIVNDLIRGLYYSSVNWDVANANSKMVTLSSFDALNLPFGKVKLSVFLSDDDAISLEAYEGASRKEIEYVEDTLLKLVTGRLDSLNWFPYGNPSNGYLTYDMRWCTFNIYVGLPAEFYNRYCSGAYGTYVKWKVLLYPEDVKINGLYVTHTWIDCTDWSEIDTFDNTLKEYQLNYNRELSDFINLFSWIDLDYELGSLRTHDFLIRLLMLAYDYRNGVFEKEICSYTFSVPVDGSKIII